MLTIIIGRANTGKTTYVVSEMKRRMDLGETGMLLIVPEQYSHDAERLLCAVCGDRLSMHGETLSFTRLCRHVFDETGGAAVQTLDAGGQMLVLHSALASVAPMLKTFGVRNMRTELLETMQNTVKEFKTLGIPPEKLDEIAHKSQNPLSDKLRDISLIYSAYESILAKFGGDAADRMAQLADKIGESTPGNSGHIYIDGFNDFTLPEMNVIAQLLRKNAEMTICLTCDTDSDTEAFELPRKTLEQLKRLAERNTVQIEMIEFGTPSEGRTGELAFLEKHIMKPYDNSRFATLNSQLTERPASPITIYAAPSRYSECEHAACKIWQLIRSGYRWRDIGVMARDWDKYSSICENVFEKYDIPFFTGGRTDILNKPPIALIDAALEITSTGWAAGNPVFRYIKTGLAGVMPDECSRMENYVHKWNIKGSMWTREWSLPPEGYGGAKLSSLNPSLSTLNTVRRHITEPLTRLRDGLRGESNAADKLLQLYAFLEEIELPERLALKADELNRRGEKRLADEYTQIWGIIVTAMEQLYMITGETKLTAAEFRKLLMLTVSRYDVGAIPAALDRTSLGSMEMNRRRDLKCLILLGATDDELPMLRKSSGILSESERSELAGQGVDIPAGFEERISREMNMIYSTLTLPSDELVVTYPKSKGERPSMIIKRIKEMFSIEEKTLKEEECMTAAMTPCLELASLYGKTNNSPIAAAAREYFLNMHSEAAEWLKSGDAHLQAGRGSLSETAAKRLYKAPHVTLTATRVEKYYSCAYQFFLYGGLRLRTRAPAAFDALTAGNFLHYILQGVFSEINDGVGFKDAGVRECHEIIERHIDKFAGEYLYSFEGKNERFIYLFRRLGENAARIVLDVLEELKNSDFNPLAFELDISKLSEAGGVRQVFDGLTLRGIVDRIDVWESGGKLYLRVIDYKSGKKSLKLTNIIYGRDMQMLIYLFALQKLYAANFNHESQKPQQHTNAPHPPDTPLSTLNSPLSTPQIVPAGVLYVPARDVILKAARNATDEQIAKIRRKETKRSGLIIRDMEVIDAMERGEEKKYLPVRYTKTGIKLGDSFISEEQTELLSGYVSHMLRRAGKEILAGSIECTPYYANENDHACTYCDYKSVCAFDPENGDNHNIMHPMKPHEAWEKLQES